MARCQLMLLRFTGYPVAVFLHRGHCTMVIGDPPVSCGYQFRVAGVLTMPDVCDTSLLRTGHDAASSAPGIRGSILSISSFRLSAAVGFHASRLRGGWAYVFGISLVIFYSGMKAFRRVKGNFEGVVTVARYGGQRIWSGPAFRCGHHPYGSTLAGGPRWIRGTSERGISPGSCR